MKTQIILIVVLFFATTVYSKEGIQYTDRFHTHRNLRLHNYFKDAKAEDADECLKECIKVPECNAVSFHDDPHDSDHGQDCFMFKDSSYYGEATSNWTSYIRNGPFQNPLTRFYEGVRLNSLKSYSILENLSVDGCWLACDRIRKQSSSCVAVTYDKVNKKCHLFAQNQYQSEVQREHKQRWITIAYEGERVLEYTMHRESGLRLHNPFATYKTNDDMECWRKCEKLVNCDAVSFSRNKQQCHFINMDNSFASSDHDWVSYTLDEIDKPLTQMFANIRLVNHFGDVTINQSPESCWLGCQRTDGCVAVTLVMHEAKDKGSCHKFKKGVYTAMEDSNSLTIALQTERSHLTGESVMYENKGLGLYNGFNITYNKTLPQCVQECDKNPICGAVCIGLTKADSSCYFYKAGKYFGESDANYTSYTKKKPYDLERAKFHDKLNLHNPYKIIGDFTSGNKDCWIECLKRQNEGCVAIYYKDKTCWLYKRGEYRSEFDEKNQYWVIALENENILEQNMFKTPNVELMNHFKEYKTGSIENCWSICLKNDQCHAITFHKNKLDTKYGRRCFLFKEGKYFGVSNSDWMSYHKKEFKMTLARYYNNTRLFAHSLVKGFSTVEECWLSCLESKDDCVAVTYNPEKYCHHYKREDYHSAVGNGWTSIARQDILIDHKAFRRVNKKLHNHYTSFLTGDAKQCWESCVHDELCEAVTFNDGSASLSKICHMFSKHEFFASKEQRWTSYTKQWYSGPMINFYEDVRLLYPFNSTRADSREKCWLKCSDLKGCDAISFNPSLKECQFFNKDEFRQTKEKGWQTLASEETDILDQTMFKRKVMLTNSYRDVRSNSINDCWNACQTDFICEAISYNNEPKTCKLAKGSSYSYERSGKWMSYFKKQPAYIPAA